MWAYRKGINLMLYPLFPLLNTYIFLILHSNLRNTLLEVFESMPNTTFIWKYEEEGSTLASHLKNVHLSTWVPQNALLGEFLKLWKNTNLVTNKMPVIFR